jgi:MFS family permease
VARSFLRTTFSSLAVRNFRLFFAGQAVSQAGTWMQSVAIVWIVLRLTDNGVALGAVMVAQFLPILILGAWAGLLCDRLDTHRLLLTTQVAFFLLALAFTIVTMTGLASLPAMYVMSVAFGALTALENPARRSLVVELVPVDQVPNVVGLNSALMTGTRVIGPALAGLVITTVGVEWCFPINAVTYLALITALLRIDKSSVRSAPPVARARAQIRDGLRYTWGTPELRLPLVLVAIVGTLAWNYPVVLPLLAERTFGGGAGAFTSLYALLSLGSLIGALVVARRVDTDLDFLVRGAFGLGVATLALASAPTFTLAVAVSVAVGFFAIFLISGSNTIVQLRADARYRGRVLALFAMVFLGTTPIGGLITGAVSEHLDPRAGVAVGGIASLVGGGWVRWQQRRAANTIDGGTETIESSFSA